LRTSRQYYATKYVFSWCLKMLRLGAGLQRLSGSEFQADSSKTPMSKNCSDDSVEQLTCE